MTKSLEDWRLKVKVIEKKKNVIPITQCLDAHETVRTEAAN